jgi:ABC-type phosphate transport system substrate-binding protein
MKRTKAAIAAAALLAGAITLAGATSASADSTPQARDVVGSGSDTSQFAMNYAADGFLSGGVIKTGYNGLANARLVSFDAITLNNVTHDNIVVRPGTAAIQRPNGSTEGKSALTTNASFNYARSSSGLSAGEISAGLQAVPFAVDGLKLSVSQAGTHAPASISAADMVKIYDGTYTNWSQLGGTSAPIKAYIPQSGSGTRAFFEGQLKSANGNVAVLIAATVLTAQEHDPSIFDPANATYGADAINAVAPFSTGRAGLSPTLVHLEGGFTAQRALYNVVRTTDLSKAWFSALFSSNGYLCSSAGKGAVESAGFFQLAIPDDGGVCGAPTTAATTNFLAN